MKGSIALILVFLLAITACACDSSNNGGTEGTSANEAASSASDTEKETESQADGLEDPDHELNTVLNSLYGGQSYKEALGVIGREGIQVGEGRIIYSWEFAGGKVLYLHLVPPTYDTYFPTEEYIIVTIEVKDFGMTREERIINVSRLTLMQEFGFEDTSAFEITFKENDHSIEAYCRFLICGIPTDELYTVLISKNVLYLSAYSDHEGEFSRYISDDLTEKVETAKGKIARESSEYGEPVFYFTYDGEGYLCVEAKFPVNDGSDTSSGTETEYIRFTERIAKY